MIRAGTDAIGSGFLRCAGAGKNREKVYGRSFCLQGGICRKTSKKTVQEGVPLSFTGRSLSDR